jgi:L-cysteine:1D-myo-inositol 2-amino-2-deoxy-alpha-D-glucopyranoside ligase
MVRLDGEKMSKSKGNLAFVSKIRLSGPDPAAIRLAILAHHYRHDWDWTDAGLAEAVARLETWREAVAAPLAAPADDVLSEVRACLADDLDAPGALAAVDRWAEATRLRGGAAGHEDTAAGAVVRDLAEALLGVTV